MTATTADKPTVPPTDENFEALRLDNQLCFALYAAAHAMNRAYRVPLGSLGLTYPQYLVMLVLWETDNKSVSELGERLRLDSGTLTPVLKRLETAGVVVRARSRADEREVEISLTELGKAMKIKALGVQHELKCRIDMSSEEVMSIRADIDQIIATLDASRVC